MKIIFFPIEIDSEIKATQTSGIPFSYPQYQDNHGEANWANIFSIYVCIPFTITRNSYFVTAYR